MNERNFIDLGKRDYLFHMDHSALQELEEMFATKDHISREDIRNVARKAAQEVKEAIQNIDVSEEQVGVIFEAMEPYLALHPRSFDADGSMAHVDFKQNSYDVTYVGTLPPDGVEPDDTKEFGDQLVVRAPKKEVDEALRSIRSALIEELRPLIDPIPFYVVEKVLHSHTVVETEDASVIKRTKDSIMFPKVYSRLITRALEQLYADLPDARSPFIEYSLIDRDTKSGIERHRKHDLKNLGELTNLKGIGPEEARKYIKYLSDNMKGAQFLLDKGLALGDINLYNLGADEQSKIGKLFDFSMLIEKNMKILNRYHAHTEIEDRYDNFSYKPPHRYEENEKYPISEQEMLYQFGICLKQLVSRIMYNGNENSKKYYYLLQDTKELGKKIISETRNALRDEEITVNISSVIGEIDALLGKYQP